MANILDQYGNVVGTVDLATVPTGSASGHPATELLATYLASRGSDPARQERKAARRAAIRKAARWSAIGIVGLAALSLWNGRDTGDTATALPTVLTAPVTAPAASSSAWYGADVDRYGVIRINDQVAGSVHDQSGASLKAAYLASAGTGAAASLLDDGLKYCRALASGDAEALKIKADTGPRVLYQTDPRALRVAEAALTHFCPRFN